MSSEDLRALDERDLEELRTLIATLKITHGRIREILKKTNSHSVAVALVLRWWEYLESPTREAKINAMAAVLPYSKETITEIIDEIGLE